LTILKYKYLVSVVAFEAKEKKELYFLTREMPETTVRHRNNSAQSCSSVLNSKRNA